MLADVGAVALVAVQSSWQPLACCCYIYRTSLVQEPVLLSLVLTGSVETCMFHALTRCHDKRTGGLLVVVANQLRYMQLG